ncbi:MAG: hypothetical protein LBQ18_05270 [Campylobacteraceae bacterium]|nr:hypothetical protein [Campylobacteraceae bacterium]
MMAWDDWKADVYEGKIIYQEFVRLYQKMCDEGYYNNNGICEKIPDCSKEVKGSIWNSTQKQCQCPIETIDVGGICSSENKDGGGECRVPVGSYVIPKTRELHEDIDIQGSDITLHYSSSRAEGYKNALYPYTVSDIANGWTLSNLHHYNNGTLYLGNGETIEYKDNEITTLKSGNTIVYDKSHIGHEFNASGSILRSFDPKSNANLYTFTYDKKSGLLTFITDRYGHTTKLNRDSNGKVLSIQSHFGQTTYLDMDSNNNLISVRYEDGSSYYFNYNSESLLTSKINPRNYTYRYEYNTNGRVSKTINPLYGEYTFSSSLNDNTAISSFTTPQGISYNYSNSKTDANGVQLSISKNPFGFETTVATSNDKRDVEKNYCSIKEKISYEIDELSMQNRLSSITKTMPSGLTNTQTFHTYYKKLTSDKYKETKEISLNSKTSTVTTDYLLGTQTITTPENRKTTIHFDLKTYLPLSITQTGKPSYTFAYNSKKQLISSLEGLKLHTYTYDKRGNLATITDALLNKYTYSYDQKDRLISAKNPNGLTLYYDYDTNDNLISILNYNSYDNEFNYNPLDQKSEWSSPLGYKTYYEYDKDKKLTKITKPSGKEIRNEYSNGLLSSTFTNEDRYDYSYDCLGQIVSISTNQDKTIYSYDGDLLTNISYQGALNQDIKFTYNPYFLPTSLTYASEKENFTYDKDNLLIKSNDLTITRDKNNANILNQEENGYEQKLSYLSSYDGIYKLEDNIDNKRIYGYTNTLRNTADKLLTQTEYLYDRTLYHTYTYDKQGRLTKASTLHSGVKNEKPSSYYYIEEFSYDKQGNILKQTIANNTQKTIRQGAYDIDDRTKIFDNTNYIYNTDGYLSSKTDAQETTTYTYGTLGELREVILPNNDKITYLYNSNNQRTAKLINNQIEEKYLWLNLTTLLAVYDKDDNLISRFYYSNDRVPYKVKHNNQIYYLSYNHQGSLKAVTDQNGQNIKSIIYSAYGNIIQDTNPNLNIHIGFAGGLYDKDTKLIRFGYRDYDPNTGKWTTKDPIDFSGGDSNLYGYVMGDPVNGVDVEGLKSYYGTFNPILQIYSVYESFAKNQDRMKEANVVYSDKYFHCMAHCQGSNVGLVGYITSFYIGEIKEARDTICGMSDSSADREANYQGLLNKSGDCRKTCGKYIVPGLEKWLW